MIGMSAEEYERAVLQRDDVFWAYNYCLPQVF